MSVILENSVINTTNPGLRSQVSQQSEFRSGEVVLARSLPMSCVSAYPTLDSDSSIHICVRCNAHISFLTDDHLTTKTTDNVDAPPSSNDAARISRLLLDAEIDLKSCDLEMSRIQFITAKLERKRQYLRRLIDQQKAFLSPARRIPSEIWGEIFLRAFETTECSFERTDYTRLPPNVFGKVCARWYRIVRSTPGLWSNLSIILNRTPVSNVERTVEILNTYLRRSGDVPLTIHVDTQRQGIPFPSFDHSQLVVFREVMQALLRHSQRWREVTLALDYTDFLADPVLSTSTITKDFPLLHSLRVDSVSLHSPEPVAINIFEFAPSLCTLSVVKVPASMLRVPWSQIINLHVADVSPSRFLELLDMTPALGNATWANPLTEQNPQALPQISSSVSSLVMKITRYEGGIDPAKALIEAVTLPALESFSMTCDFYQRWFHTSFTELIVRSNPMRLARLSLRHIAILDAELLEVLRMVPFLTNLTFDQSVSVSCGLTRPFTRVLFEGLEICDNDNTTPLVPRLSSLCLSATHPFAEAEFLRMVGSRWVHRWSVESSQPKVAAWRDIGLRIDSVIGGLGSEALQEKLCELQDLGIPIEVQHLKEGVMTMCEDRLIR